MTFTRETLVSKVTKWTKGLQENVEVAIEELFAKYTELAAKEKALEENVASKGEGGGGGGEVALAPALSGHVYVRPGGNNANSGGSWSSAKKDIANAIEALPLIGLDRYGVVHLSFGTHTVASILVRTDSLSFKGKTKYVEAPSAKASDIGNVLMVPKLKGAASTEMVPIEDAWEGELSEPAKGSPAPINKKPIPATGGPTGTNKRFFTLQGEPGKSGGAIAMWVINPALKLPNGVALEGSGASAGSHSYLSPGVTTIKDTGTGITIYLSSAEEISPKSPGMRSMIRNLTLDGSGTAIDSFCGINSFMVTWENFVIKRYLRWGINSGNNGMSNASFINGSVQECGHVHGEVGGQIEIAGGGMRVFEGAPVGVMVNVNCRNNFGTNCIGGGIHALGCLFNGAFPQEYPIGSKKYLPQSGVGFWDESAITPSNITGAWFEGNAFVNVVAAGTHLISCHFQAKHGPGTTGLEPLHTHYAIEAGPGGVTIDNCYFIRNFSVALIKEANTESTISWRNCQISGGVTEEAQAIPWNNATNYAAGALVEWTSKSGVNWVALQENAGNEPKEESEFWEEYTGTNPFIERNKAPNILAPGALGSGMIVGVSSLFQQGVVTGPMNAVKATLNPQRIVLGTSTNLNILRLTTKSQEGLKVTVTESGATSKIVISNAGGILQETPFKAKASELFEWYNETEILEAGTKKEHRVFKNLAFRALVTMIEGTEYNTGKTSKIEGKVATALVPQTSVVYVNPFDRDVRLTQVVNFGSEGGGLTFARGSAIGGQAILTEQFSAAMTINTSLIPLAEATKKGYTVGSLVVFTKFNANVAGLDVAIPYWVYTSSESGIEVSKVPFGEAGAAAITVRNAAPAKSSEVALLMTWKQSGSGEGIVQDLYLPARYSLSMALTKGASLSGQAILTPA